MSKVLVTGGSGFIASHVILQLLQAGYEVRTTVRNLNREEDVRAMLRAGSVEAGNRLTFVTADLEKDGGWNVAVAGCEFVHHVASPFPAAPPKHEDELIVPAREGALRVLRASRDAGVKRVVLTSSFAAIGYGREPLDRPFDERDWSDPESTDIGAYAKSKTLAERAAWEFIAREGGGMELSVVNPVGVFGPVLAKDYSTSILIVSKMLDGALPGLPRIWFGAVDVRDVADIHMRCMKLPAAAGERYLAVAGDFLAFREIAAILKQNLGAAAGKVPTREIPNWMVRLAALADPAVKLILPELGKKKTGSNRKAREVLGWNPRSREEAIVSTAESLLRIGV
jgi:nucleoside-diphosphate-sugar epimerase